MDYFVLVSPSLHTTHSHTDSQRPLCFVLAGKSTLLRILAGKKLTKTKTARIMGQDVFMNPPGGVVYLGTEWANNPVIRSDIGIADFLDSVGGYRYKERRDVLLDLLDVDLEWQVSSLVHSARGWDLTPSYPSL